LAATREALQSTDLPPGLRYRLVGEEEQRATTFRNYLSHLRAEVGLTRIALP